MLHSVMLMVAIKTLNVIALQDTVGVLIKKEMNCVALDIDSKLQNAEDVSITSSRSISQ